MALSPSVIRILIVVFVALGSLTYGYSSSIIATTLGQPSFITYFHMDTRPNATDISGAINGLFQAGGFIGTLVCYLTADWLGRRKALALWSIVAIISGALQAGSVTIGMFMAMRGVTGASIGALVTLVPLYQSEIAPPKIRGLLVGMHGSMIGTGYMIASYVGLGFYFVDASGAQWRIPLAIQCVPPLLLTAGVMLLPETPRWLLLNDRVEEAFAAYKATRAETSDALLSDDEAIRADFELLHRQTVHEVANDVPFIDLFRKPTLRRRCIIGFLTTFGCQATATIVINNYGPLLYKGLGFGTVQQLLIQCGWITVAPLGNFINALLVDHIGRVRMLVLGWSGCVIALVGECITVSVFSRTGDRGAASGAVFFLFLHVTIFTLCCDATSYVYAAEIFPTPIRAKGLSVSVSGLFFATIIFTTAAPTAFANIGWKYYLIFVVLTTVITIYAYFTFPETRKRSLEEIQAIFGDAVEGVSVDDVPEHAAPQETSDEDKDEKITVDLSNNKLG